MAVHVPALGTLELRTAFGAIAQNVAEGRERTETVDELAVTTKAVCTILAEATIAKALTHDTKLTTRHAAAIGARSGACSKVTSALAFMEIAQIWVRLSWCGRGRCEYGDGLLDILEETLIIANNVVREAAVLEEIEASEVGQVRRIREGGEACELGRDAGKRGIGTVAKMEGTKVRAGTEDGLKDVGGHIRTRVAKVEGMNTMASSGAKAVEEAKFFCLR